MEPKASRQTAQAADAATRVSAVLTACPTGRTLDLALRAALADPWIDEVVIVDTGAPPALASHLRALKADRRDVALIQAKGVTFAEAANLAAGKARGRWLLFLDPSVVVKRGAAQRLVAAARGSNSPWAVSGRLLDSKGRERPSVRRRLPTPLSVLFGAGRLTRAPKAQTLSIPVCAVGGAMVLTPRKDFLALGGFGDSASMEAETLDLCRRIGESGGEVRYAPRAEAVQLGAGVGGASPAREAQGLASYLRRTARSPWERRLAAAAGVVLAVSAWFGGRGRA